MFSYLALEPVTFGLLYLQGITASDLKIVALVRECFILTTPHSSLGMMMGTRKGTYFI